MRRVLLAVIALTLAAGPVPAQTDKAAPPQQGVGAKAKGQGAEKGKGIARQAAAPASGPQVAVLETVLGNIVIKFHEAEAPRTVANFKKLVGQGFYDGTYFHRVIQGFMIQGGDPNSKNADPNDDGLGNPGYTVPAEIKLPHVRGAVATARTGDQVNPERASSGSQFFIDVAAQPSLDRGGYTVFGQVIQGMDVVDRIVALATDPGTPRGPAGPNPGKKALVKKAYLAPLADYQK